MDACSHSCMLLLVHSRIYAFFHSLIPTFMPSRLHAFIHILKHETIRPFTYLGFAENTKKLCNQQDKHICYLQNAGFLAHMRKKFCFF